MKRVFVAALLALAVTTQTVLVSSGPSTTIITSPPSQVVGVEAYHTANHPNYLGNGAQWIWVSGSSSWPHGYSATFQALYYADCPQVSATLRVTADNTFTIYNNGVQIGTGSDWTKVFIFTLKLQCGWNNLTIVAVNWDAGSPAALVFSVIQDQSTCYDCRENPSAFYNREKCTCQCSTICRCHNLLQIWVNYPTCGCKCNIQTFAACNPLISYWSDRTCSCVCKKIWCPLNYVQNPSTCQCVCKKQQCPLGFIWNEKKCACEKLNISNDNTAVPANPSLPGVVPLRQKP